MNPLDKLYIEVTALCNLDCRTCMRNSWDEPMGRMDEGLFDRILGDLNCLSPAPTIFFGGIGEPLSHPGIVQMVEKSKRIGARVELITNGILLTEGLGKALVGVGLDGLWVSIDGANPQSYMDVRLGDYLPVIVANLGNWQKIANGGVDLGITFVAMKRNIADLQQVVSLAKHLGARRFSLSNVEAYTPDLVEERLYSLSISEKIPGSGCRPPRFDGGMVADDLLADINQTFIGPEPSLIPTEGACPFSLRRSLSIRWDGEVGPCLPLLHGHNVHFKDHDRPWPSFTHGSLRDKPLAAIMTDETFTDFHQRLQNFAFAPCLSCNGCDLPSFNGEDCFGNTHPACGGCLWAQGFIVCP